MGSPNAYSKGAAVTSPTEESDRAWSAHREAYWRERVSLDGRDDDYVGLARVLLAKSAEVDGCLEEAYRVLTDATGRHPRSVPIWEHLALVASLTGHQPESEAALSSLESLDPSSNVLSVADEITPSATREWAENAASEQARLLELAGSTDEAVARDALVMLRRWTRSYPTNSTYAVNYAFGLFAAGDKEQACKTALAALQIEDGSFADAANIGRLLLATGATEQARPVLAAAIARAESHGEKEVAARIVAEIGERDAR